MVVIISIIEFILAKQEQEAGANSESMSLTIFRGFRLLRVFRLARRWQSFHKMMVKIGQTVKDIFTFFVLLLIIVFVYSLLGVELFSNYVKFDSDHQIVPIDDPDGLSPRFNFESFQEGFVSVFVCLIGDDWQNIMHDYIRANKSRIAPCLFFISLMIIGNLFLMNLFLAILLKNFEDVKDSQNNEEDKEETFKSPSSMMNSAFQTLKGSIRKVLARNNEYSESNSSKISVAKHPDNKDDKPNQ